MIMDDELKLALLEAFNYVMDKTDDPNYACHVFHELYELVTKRIKEWRTYEE